MKINLFLLLYENIMKSKRLSCFTEIVRFIDFLQNLPSRNTVGFDEAKYHIEQLKIVEILVN